MSGVFVFAGVEAADPIGLEDVKTLCCVGCLAVSRPLRPLERATAALYGELVGTAVSVSDMYPKFVCLYCRALLLKFKAFREMCRASQTFFSVYSADNSINLDLIKSEVSGVPYPALETSHMENISLQPEISHDPATKSNNGESKGMNEASTSGIFIELNSAGHSSLSIDKTNNANRESISSLSDNYNISEDIKRKEIENIIKREPHNTEDILVVTSNYQNCDKLSQTSYSVREIKIEISKADSLKSNEGGAFSDSDSNSTVAREIDEVDKLKKKTHAFSKKHRKKRERKDNVAKPISKRIKPSNCYETNEKKFNVKIVELSKEEQLKQFEERKNSLNYKKYRFRCDLCYHAFSNEVSLKSHMAKHDPSRGDHACEICHSRFRIMARLRSHVELHKYDYICNECGVVNKSLQSAAIHYKWHKGVKYNCKICGKTFDKPTSVFSHMHLTHEAAEKCPICDKKCIGRKGLLAHMQQSHKEAKGAVCRSCNTQFHNVSALQHHLSVGCDVTRSPCIVCGEGFTTGQLLEEHKIECHSESYTCGKCSKTFDDKNKYILHCPNCKRRRRYKAESQICHICGIHVQGQRKRLENHYRAKHTNEKPFQCDYCQKRFALKHLLMAHIIGHVNKIHRKIKCRYCDKYFTLAKNRDRHEDACLKRLNNKNEYKMHCSQANSKRGQRRYKAGAESHICHICGITVKGHKVYLKYHHRAKHTNERPYQCDYCQKRFALKHLLLAHIIGHVNKIHRKIKCRYCEKYFSLAKNRDRHEDSVHKKLTPFECPLCAKAFNVKFTMDSHIKHTHQGIPWPQRINRARGRKQQGNASLVRQETSRMESDPSGNGEEQ